MKTRRTYGPAVEMLEDRYTPAGTVTGSLTNGTWILRGDAEANSIRINPTATPGQFTLTGLNTTVTGVTNPTGVKNIVVKLFAGDDYVAANDTALIGKLAGALTINGGSGANAVDIERFRIARDLTVINGTNTNGYDSFNLGDSIVRGNVIINNGNGNSETYIFRDDSTISAVGKNIFITNGVGKDHTVITDTNIGGHVVARNGLPDAASIAGYFNLYNYENQTTRSVIGGNVVVRYAGAGTINYDGIWDYEILGNVTLHHGRSTATTYIDGYSVNQPVLVHGNLTIIDHGKSLIDIGRHNYYETGLVVGKQLTVSTGGEADQFYAHRLVVNGATRITTGAGADLVEIDDSRFFGPSANVSPYGFQLLTGAGADVVNIDTASNTDLATQFLRAVHINLGLDADALTLGESNEYTKRVEFLSKADLLGGVGVDTLYRLNVDAVFASPIKAAFETIVP